MHKAVTNPLAFPVDSIKPASITGLMSKEKVYNVSCIIDNPRYAAQKYRIAPETFTNVLKVITFRDYNQQE